MAVPTQRPSTREVVLFGFPTTPAPPRGPLQPYREGVPLSARASVLRAIWSTRHTQSFCRANSTALPPRSAATVAALQKAIRRVFLVCVLAVVGAQRLFGQDANQPGVEPGDTREQVVELLGKPTYAVGSSGNETLRYPGGKVRLVDGKVVEVVGQPVPKGDGEGPPSGGDPKGDGEEPPSGGDPIVVPSRSMVPVVGIERKGAALNCQFSFRHEHELRRHLNALSSLADRMIDDQGYVDLSKPAANARTKALFDRVLAGGADIAISVAFDKIRNPSGTLAQQLADVARVRYRGLSLGEKTTRIASRRDRDKIVFDFSGIELTKFEADRCFGVELSAVMGVLVEHPYIWSYAIGWQKSVGAVLCVSLAVPTIDSTKAKETEGSLRELMSRVDSLKGELAKQARKRKVVLMSSRKGVDAAPSAGLVAILEKSPLEAE